MATNIKYDSTDVLTFVAGSSRTVGTPVLEGNVIVVPLESCDSGAEYAAQVRGRVYIPKTSAQAWSQGDAIYWNAGTSLTTNVQTGTLRQIGQAGAAAANPSSYGYVDLGVGIEADSDVGTLTANLASTGAGKGTALIGDEVSGGTLKAKLDTCATMAAVGGAGELLYTAAADRAAAKSGVVAANVPQMAAAGGVDELLYTAAADRAVAKSGITRAAVNNIPASITVTAGAEAANTRQIDIDIKGILGTNVAAIKHVFVYTSSTALGASAVLVDTGITAATAGTVIVDDTVAGAMAHLLTDATGNCTFGFKHAAGALTVFLNVICGDVVASVDTSFAA